MLKKIRIEHFANLVAVAFADGLLTEDELTLLKNRAIELGLNEKDVQEILDKKNSLMFMVPMNQEDCEQQLSDVILMSMIDGEIHEKEYQLCLNIAQKLGFDEKYLNYAIDLSKKLMENNL